MFLTQFHLPLVGKKRDLIFCVFSGPREQSESHQDRATDSKSLRPDEPDGHQFVPPASSSSAAATESATPESASGGGPNKAGLQLLLQRLQDAADVIEAY